MVYVSYSFRVLVDYDFVKWLSSLEMDEKSVIVGKLLRININSKEYKKENVVILESDFGRLCEEGIIKGQEMLRGALHRIPESEIPNSEDYSGEILRVILGINLASKLPSKKIVIFTTKEGKEGYYKNEDLFRGLVNPIVTDESESEVILDDLYDGFKYERADSH